MLGCQCVQMFKIYVLPVVSAIKPRDWKTNQNSDIYMISGNGTKQTKQRKKSNRSGVEKAEDITGVFEGSADR